MPEGPTVGWRDIANVVKASAVKRLGMPLLKLYAVIALIGIITITASLVAMRLGW